MNTPPNLNPFIDRPEAAPRRWTSRGWLALLLAVWSGLAVMLVACGGLGYFGMVTGESKLEKIVLEEIAQHPVIAEHLGSVQAVTVLPKSPLDMRPDAKEQPDFIVTAEGDKGRGYLWMYQSRSPRTEGFFSKIDLSLPNGEKIVVK